MGATTTSRCPSSGRRTATSPPLVASLGGDRTIREIAPLVDRVELKLNAPATRDGSLDFVKLAEIPRSHLADLVAKVRAVNPTVPLGVLILCSVGEDARTRALEEQLGDSLMGGFFGPVDKVVARCGRWPTSGWSGSRSARSPIPATSCWPPTWASCDLCRARGPWFSSRRPAPLPATGTGPAKGR